MKIGELAKTTGTKVETIRYYEASGLLPNRPERRAIIATMNSPIWNG